MMKIVNLKNRYNIDVDIDQLVYDTRDITSKNALFFCINDTSYSYVDLAVELGVKYIICDRKLDKSIPHIVVDDVLVELSDIASELNNYPANDLEFIAITGTDGKTTTAQIIQHTIRVLQGNCGYVGTNGVIYEGFNEKYFCTVPFPPLLQKSLDDMRNANEKTVVVETTSQALYLKRVESLKFKALTFTNFTADHLDFHKTLENYLEAKLHSLDLLTKDATIVLNLDDDSYSKFASRAKDHKIYTYSINNRADFRAINIEYYSNKINFDIEYQGELYSITTSLIGKFNVYNILAAFATVYSYGFKDLNEIASAINKLQSVEGRSMFIENNLGVDIIIDFAHTSNAVENILSFLHETTSKENKRLISLMGVPGRRDTTKRPIIGKTLTTYSDFVYFTSDDPRDEDPNKILDELTSCTIHSNYKRIVDRKEAVREMIMNAKKGDVLVFLGKGSEDKIAIGNENVDYLEEQVVREVLEEMS